MSIVSDDQSVVNEETERVSLFRFWSSDFLCYFLTFAWYRRSFVFFVAYISDKVLNVKWNLWGKRTRELFLKNKNLFIQNYQSLSLEHQNHLYLWLDSFNEFKINSAGGKRGEKMYIIQFVDGFSAHPTCKIQQVSVPIIWDQLNRSIELHANRVLGQFLR